MFRRKKPRVVVIGAGGHAQDIFASILWPLEGSAIYAHHTDYDRRAGDRVIIAINDQRVRAKVAAQLGIVDESWVHPAAHIGPGCWWGHGTHIYHHASLTRTTMGTHCQISPGAVICGDVTLGDRVFVGANATIVNLCTVPSDTFVRPGTVWTQR